MNTADVCIAHYREDLSWLDKLDSLRFVPRVVSKTDTHAYLYTPLNRGFEASAYLAYILHRYDSLPEYTIFVQGSEYAWHHIGSLADVLNGLSLCGDYHNFNDWTTPSESEPGFVKSFVVNGVVPDRHRFEFNMWSDLRDVLFPSLHLLPNPDTFAFKMCAAPFPVV